MVRGKGTFGNAIHSFESRAAAARSKCALVHTQDSFRMGSEGRTHGWVSNGQKVTSKHISPPFGSWHNWVTGRHCLSWWHENLSSNSCFYNQTITPPEYRFELHKKHFGNWFNPPGLAVTTFHNLVTSQLFLPLPEKLLAAPEWQSKDKANIILLSDLQNERSRHWTAGKKIAKWLFSNSINGLMKEIKTDIDTLFSQAPPGFSLQTVKH